MNYEFPNKSERVTVWKWILWILVILVAVSMIVSVVGFAMGWLSLPGKILNPDQGLARWQWFYDQNAAITAVGSNISTTEQEIADFQTQNGSSSTWDVTQRNQYSYLLVQKNGYVTQYNNLVASYNAKMNDVTRNWSAPPDLPRHISNWGQ
jgi:uncharacterized membrane protein